MGVGGYFNIIIFDAKEDEPDKRFIEIFDNRAKLASEIVHSYYNKFINYEDTYELINELIYNRQKNFEEVNDAFLSSSGNPLKMGKFLRGYKV